MDKGLHLITQSTPNGQKVQILLEELKDVYNTPFTTTLIDIRTNVQKSDWFLRLNPNGTFHSLSFVLLLYWQFNAPATSHPPQ